MVKSNSEYKSIQKKLVAAVAMVLVASIMVVSSSYAWFTLSTAPEVTGIQTAVGSNGNLEMALMEEAGKEPQTATGVAYPSSNNYWGNLVDLSDPSYHFANMSLRPARLNAEEDTANTVYADVQKTKDGVLVWTTDNGTTEFAADQGYAGDSAKAVYLADGKTQKTKDNVPVWQKANTEGEANQYAAETKASDNDTKVMVKEAQRLMYKLKSGGFLMTPVYGVDGRVSQLTANTTNGFYKEDSNAFAEDSTNMIRGVRAVGTMANISPAELALRNAKQAVNAAISTSKTNATISLRDDSVALANLIVNSYIDSSYTYDSDDKTVIQNAINNLTTIVNSLENALKEAVVALGVSKGLSFTAEAVTLSATDITVSGLTEAQVETLWPTGDTRKAEILGYYADITTMRGDLTSAQTKLTAISATSGISFEMISEPLTSLLSTNDFKITDPSNGIAYTVGDFQKLGMLKMGTIMLSTPTITIIDGIYQDIARFSGNYSATTSMFVSGDFEGVGELNQNVTVVMTTSATEPFHLPKIQNWMSSLQAVSGGSATSLITDIYGYAVDLAFRTNAANSSLQLQTEAANRVEDSELTQGSGSYLEFKSGHADFTVEQVANLMNSIRVVFVDESGTIYGIAGVEIEFTYDSDATQEGTQYVPYTSTSTNPFHGVTTPAGGTEAAEYEMFMVGGTVQADNATIKAPLYLMDYTFNSDGTINIVGKKSNTVIADLTQNTAKYISALVYLDGDEVENSDVAIAGNSMTGTMNLQFSSSAELDPMDYTFQTTQLTKPSVSYDVNSRTLTITAVDHATAYKIYAGDLATPIHTIENGTLTYAIPNSYDGLTGDVSITVVASANGYTDSVKSDAVTVSFTAGS